MDKNLLKNSWILFGLLLVIALILNLVIRVVTDFFKIGIPQYLSIGIIVGAMLLGQIYTKNFKEIMPKKLRFNVATIFLSVQLFGILAGMWLIRVLGDVETHKSLSEFYQNWVLIVGMLLLYSMFIYLLLGSGKGYLVWLQQKNKSNKNKNKQK